MKASSEQSVLPPRRPRQRLASGGDVLPAANSLFWHGGKRRNSGGRKAKLAAQVRDTSSFSPARLETSETSEKFD